MIAAATLDAADIRTIDDFKEWTRTSIRSIFPHAALACGLGHLHAGGVGLDYAVTIDYPVEHLEGIRNRAGGIDTPILRRWLATLEPQWFDLERPWPETPAAWLESFRRHDMRNTAAHGVYDTQRCVATYHSFQRIPGRVGPEHAEALRRIVPLMHDVLCRVIELLDLEDSFATRLAGLSAREKEIAGWVGLGKTNSEIAILSGASENTVKHHMTHIFLKLCVETRAQLVHRLTEYEMKMAPGFGTKIL
jgi:DNA-binding CsgD family transcriptional regulator